MPAPVILGVDRTALRRALEPADRPKRVRITKVRPGGQREEGERALSELLEA